MLSKMELGRTGMEITQLGYGAMEMRNLRGEGGRVASEEQVGKVLNAVLDAGINFVDTSWCYGRSEEFIGRHIGHRRNEYFLATKGGHYWRDDPERSGWSREGLMNCINESLTRLGTDHVDILQLHNATPEQVREYACISTLKEIQAQGKTRFIGMSTVLPYINEFIDMDVFDTFQIPYSALEPEHEAAISRAALHGAGTIIRGGIAKGAPVVDPSERPRITDLKAKWDKDDLSTVAPGVEPAELILRYTLSHPDVQTTIVGTQSLEHLAANIRAAQQGALDSKVVEEIRSRVGAG